MCLIGQELIHELVTTTFFGAVRSGPHMHGLVLFVIIIYGTSLHIASLVVLCEIRTNGHKFRMQPGPIVHTCTTYANNTL